MIKKRVHALQGHFRSSFSLYQKNQRSMGNSCSHETWYHIAQLLSCSQFVKEHWLPNMHKKRGQGFIFRCCHCYVAKALDGTTISILWICAIQQEDGEIGEIWICEIGDLVLTWNTRYSRQQQLHSGWDMASNWASLRGLPRQANLLVQASEWVQHWIQELDSISTIQIAHDDAFYMAFAWTEELSKQLCTIFLLQQTCGLQIYKENQQRIKNTRSIFSKATVTSNNRTSLKELWNGWTLK